MTLAEAEEAMLELPLSEASSLPRLAPPLVVVPRPPTRLLGRGSEAEPPAGTEDDWWIIARKEGR